MFQHRTTDAEPEAIGNRSPAALIPLSHLQLDLEPPPDGWSMFLAHRGIQVVPDSLGRDSIGMDAARRLFDERRELVLRQAALQAVAEQAAVEQDQARRAQLPSGISAAALNGMSYAEAMRESELASQTYSPRTSLVEDVLNNGGGGFTFHPFRQSEGE